MKPQQTIQPHNSTLITNCEASKYPVLIDKIFTCVNDHLLLLMNQMLSTADEKLKAKAGKAKTKEERNKFMDCTQVFRTERNDINHHFFINLNKSLVISQVDTGNSEDNKSALVNQDEMDEMVAITTMHSKAMNIYGDEVNHLEARLEYLEIMCQEIFDKEALEPKHICEIFQRTRHRRFTYLIQTFTHDRIIAVKQTLRGGVHLCDTHLLVGNNDPFGRATKQTFKANAKGLLLLK